MAGKAVISMTTGLEDPEKVMVAFLVAVGAAELGRPTWSSSPRKPSGSPSPASPSAPPAAAAPACRPCSSATKRPAARSWSAPSLLQRQPTRCRATDHQRRARRHCPDVAMDRRRGRHHLQLL